MLNSLNFLKNLYFSSKTLAKTSLPMPLKVVILQDITEFISFSYDSISTKFAARLQEPLDHLTRDCKDRYSRENFTGFYSEYISKFFKFVVICSSRNLDLSKQLKDQIGKMKSALHKN